MGPAVISSAVELSVGNVDTGNPSDIHRSDSPANLAWSMQQRHRPS